MRRPTAILRPNSNEHDAVDRRLLLAAVLGLVAAMLVGSVITVAAPAASAAPTGGTVLWTSSGPGSGTKAFDAALSPGGDELYVVGSQRVTGHRRDLLVVALDAASGSPAWTKTIGGTRGDDASSVAVSPDGATVFVVGSWGKTATGDVKWRGHLVVLALDALTGQRKWMVRDGRYLEGHDSDPIVMAGGDGNAVVVAGFIGFTPSGGMDDEVHTFSHDPNDGQIAWDVEATGTVPWLQGATLSPDGGSVYISMIQWGSTTDTDISVAALDEASGTELWSNIRPIDHGGAQGIVSDPDGSQVFLAGDYSNSDGRVAIDATTGVEQWYHGYADVEGDEGWPHLIIGHALVAGPDMLFSGGQYPPQGEDFGPMGVRSIDPSDGSLLWQVDVGTPEGYGDASSLALSPDHLTVYVAGLTTVEKSKFGPKLPILGMVAALDSQTGAQEWEHTGGAIPVALLVRHTDGSVIVVDARGSVEAYLGS